MLNQPTIDKLLAMRMEPVVEAWRAFEQDENTQALSFEEKLSLMVDRLWTWRQNLALERRMRYAKLRGNACVEDINYRAARGLDRNILVEVGLVVLVGLAAKNAILIVEFARQAEANGMTRFEAAVAAARTRLRPILMTSLAFILGVVPLAIAVGAGAEMRQSLGTAVFAGLHVKIDHADAARSENSNAFGNCFRDIAGVNHGSDANGALGFGELGNIGRRLIKAQPNPAVLFIPAACTGDIFLMQFVVEIGAVVVDQNQQRNLMADGCPDRGGAHAKVPIA